MRVAKTENAESHTVRDILLKDILLKHLGNLIQMHSIEPENDALSQLPWRSMANSMILLILVE